MISNEISFFSVIHNMNATHTGEVKDSVLVDFSNEFCVF